MWSSPEWGSEISWQYSVSWQYLSAIQKHGWAKILKGTWATLLPGIKWKTHCEVSVLHHTQFTNCLFSLPSGRALCVPSRDVERNLSGLALRIWTEVPFLSPLRHPNTCLLHQRNGTLFPGTSPCFTLYGERDGKFNTLSSADERTALTEERVVWARW